jgi:hypothetical protein
VIARLVTAAFFLACAAFACGLVHCSPAKSAPPLESVQPADAAVAATAPTSPLPGPAPAPTSASHDDEPAPATPPPVRHDGRG